MSTQQTQLDFEAADKAEIEATRPKTWTEKFADFHAANPHVYEFIRDRAMKLKRYGHKKWSIEEIWNNLRWVKQCPTTGKPYSLNNNFKRFYVDLLLEREPSLEGFFNVRERRSQ